MVPAYVVKVQRLPGAVLEGRMSVGACCDRMSALMDSTRTFKAWQLSALTMTGWIGCQSLNRVTIEQTAQLPTQILVRARVYNTKKSA